MSLSTSIAKNTFIHAAGKFLASGLGLVVVALLTRYLGAEGFGYYTTILSYLYFFSTAGDLGLYLIALNELGKNTEQEKENIYSHILSLRLVAAIIFMILADIFIWFFPYSPVIKLGVIIISISVLSMMIDQIIVAIFQEKMQTKFAAVAEFVGKATMLLLVYIFIKLDWGIIALLAASSFGLIVHSFLNLYFARKFLKFSLRYHKETWQKILKNSWPVATYLIFSMIYFKADTIILSLYHPQAVVGIYGAPYKILEVLVALPAIFMGLVTPLLAKAWAENNFHYFKNVYQKAFDFLSLIIWPLIGGVFVLAEKIMIFIAGQEFLPSAPIFRLLIVATAIIFMAHLSTFSVVAINKQKSMMRFYMVAAVIAVALYLIFIPRYYYWAAALITVVVESFILICSWVLIKKEAGLKIDFILAKKSFLAGFLMTLTIYFIKTNLFFSIILAILSYAIFLWLLGVIKKENFDLILKK